VKRTLVLGALATALSLSACTATASVATAPSLSPTSAQRTEATLKQALLALEDLPDGYEVQPGAEEGGATPVARSQDPKCESFVRLINADALPGSKASALVAFAGGPDGPFAEEWIEAMADAAAVADIETQLAASVEECGEVTVSLPGSGAADMELSAVDAPAVGDNPVAYRMTAMDGSFGGLEITFVHTGVDDTLLTMNFVSIDPAEIEGLVTAAHAKAAKVLGVTSR
jgi:hypothetical protein